VLARFVKYWLIVLCMAAMGCQDTRQPPDGGYCSYKDTAIPARVISIVPVNDGQYDILFILDSNTYRPAPVDTVSFYAENGQYLDKAIFDSLGVDTGKVYTFLVREIVEGSCNPFITTLVLKPFRR
jgi:hypothetical protein